jgi:hypothetical protein
MMQRYMSNTFNAVHHLAVTVRSDIYMKCNIYSEKNNDFQKVKSSLKVGESVKSEEAVLLFIVDLLTAAKFTRAYNMYNKDTICKG